MRSHVWSYMEAKDFAIPPRPVHHRIPNFEHTNVITKAVADLDVFTKAQTVLVTNDHVLQKLRRRTLLEHKTLIVPNLFYAKPFIQIQSDQISKIPLNRATKRNKIVTFGERNGLETNLKADLVILGSVAVHPETGARIGTGDGKEEILYGLLRDLNIIDASTPILTCVHDAQISDSIVNDHLEEHDLAVNIAVTPTRIITIDSSRSHPEGIYWRRLSSQQLRRYPVLKEYKASLESEGKQIRLSKENQKVPTPFFPFGMKKRKR